MMNFDKNEISVLACGISQLCNGLNERVLCNTLNGVLTADKEKTCSDNCKAFLEQHYDTIAGAMTIVGVFMDKLSESLTDSPNENYDCLS